MFKVHILDRCSYCEGAAYLLAGETTDWKGNPYTKYVPCPVCEGSGNQPRWVSLTDFAEMLKMATCKHEHVSSQGGMHYSDGDVWDDIEEVCSDCGANLSRQDMGIQIHEDN